MEIPLKIRVADKCCMNCMFNHRETARIRARCLLFDEYLEPYIRIRDVTQWRACKQCDAVIEENKGG